MRKTVYFLFRLLFWFCWKFSYALLHLLNFQD
jgi:hypothetical protein